MRDLASPAFASRAAEPPQALPGQIVRQARKARLHRLVSPMPAMLGYTLRGNALESVTLTAPFGR